jgi:hypothetical protein
MKTLKIIVLFISISSFSQKLSKEELLKELSDATCKCSENKEFTKDNLEIILGICIVEAIGKNPKAVEKHYGANYMTKSMKQIGQEIAPNIMLNCPKVSSLIMDKAKEKYASEEEEEEVVEEDNDIVVKGTFTSSSVNEFLFVNIKEDSGKTHELIIINNFENAYLITDKILKANDKIEVDFFEGVLYNVKTNKFENYKILNNITKL